MLIRVVDLETTGLSPPAEIIEVGWSDVRLTEDGWTVDPPSSKLFRPTAALKPVNMAIHHLTAAAFDEECEPCSAAMLSACLMSGAVANLFVAHNLAFERQFIPRLLTGKIPWACSYRAARRVWPEAPRHSNQILRYWRGLDLDPALAMPPHRAGPDSYVTAHLVADLLKVLSPEQLIRVAGEQLGSGDDRND